MVMALVGVWRMAYGVQYLTLYAVRRALYPVILKRNIFHFDLFTSDGFFNHRFR